MKRMLKSFCLVLALSGTAFGGGEPAGEFDYFVLSLSWNSSWCRIEGDSRGAGQCDPGHGYGFTLHGLWPQYETGWPSYCRTAARDPSRAETAAMADIMGSAGLAWHQWKKHGRCSGLGAQAYFATARRAFDSIGRPQTFRRLSRDTRLPPGLVEAAFIEENPEIPADGLTVTCKSGMLQEVRICLTRDLAPRECGADVLRDCPAHTVVMPPVR